MEKLNYATANDAFVVFNIFFSSILIHLWGMEVF